MCPFYEGHFFHLMKESILGKLIGLFYWLYASTFRYKLHFEDASAEEGYKRLKTKGTNKEAALIVAVWHQDEMSALNLFGFSKTFVMVSDSKDGSIFSSALHFLGFETVRGSSTRGGVKAFIGAIKKLRDGYSMAIAIDGPRGPIYEVKDGVIKLAEKTEKPILPMRFNPRNCFTFKKAWAQSRLPKPFSVVDIHVGTCGNYTKESLKEKLISFD